jgi:hypothetical protein
MIAQLGEILSCLELVWLLGCLLTGHLKKLNKKINSAKMQPLPSSALNGTNYLDLIQINIFVKILVAKIRLISIFFLILSCFHINRKIFRVLKECDRLSHWSRAA